MGEDCYKYGQDMQYASWLDGEQGVREARLELKRESKVEKIVERELNKYVGKISSEVVYDIRSI